MNIGESFHNPADDNEFTVTKIEGGYSFYLNKECTEFFVDENTVETKVAATGFHGKQGMAIELFRNWLFNNPKTI